MYSVYGPLEERSRLVPSLVVEGMKGGYPPLVDPAVSRDFVYIDDACEAFIDCAMNLTPEDYGESFNIGTGTSTSIGELAHLTRDLFQIESPPTFSTMARREWDTASLWRADPTRAKERLGWVSRTTVREGLGRTIEWYKSLPDKTLYERHAKGYQSNPNESISAVIACYRDGQAIPIMYERLVRVFEKLHVDYEIIFVNDGSPDDTQNVIQEISGQWEPPGDRDHPQPQLRLSGSVSQRVGDFQQTGLCIARRRLAGSAGVDRTVRRKVARGLRCGVWPPCETRSAATDAHGIQSFLCAVQPDVLRVYASRRRRFLANR